MVGWIPHGGLGRFGYNNGSITGVEMALVMYCSSRPRLDGDNDRMSHEAMHAVVDAARRLVAQNGPFNLFETSTATTWVGRCWAEADLAIAAGVPLSRSEVYLGIMAAVGSWQP